MTQRIARSSGRASPDVLLVDPSDLSRETLAEVLRENGLHCIEERDGLAGWNRFLAREPGAVLAALDLPGLNGLELLSRVRGQATTPFVFHSPKNDASLAITAIKAGADDFIVLPDEIATAPRRLEELIEQHLGVSLREQVEAMILGRSSAIARVREKVQGLSGLTIPVLVRGEAGSGRDHVISTLVAMDAGNNDPPVIVRSTAARAPSRSDAGRIVYLDSVDRFPLRDQHLWAEQIDAATRHDVGAPRRVLASTAADLQALADSGLLEPALARLLTHFTIELPPLRDRREDIMPLARALAEQVAARMGRTRVLITDPAIQLLRRQPWPGNVRELCTIVERLVAYSQNGRITRANVTAVLRERPSSVTALRISEEKRQRVELTDLLAATGGNLAEVGRRLGMSRGAVIYRAQKFGLLERRR